MNRPDTRIMVRTTRIIDCFPAGVIAVGTEGVFDPDQGPADDAFAGAFLPNDAALRDMLSTWDGWLDVALDDDAIETGAAMCWASLDHFTIIND